ncbi:hypothetical protein V6N12_063056 [Hibiscus sabdariffa]|uniref:Putative plant transposon protein domain-containing protein n=1 Tax=Hibiscus sabdariffa TaxID=183260 RepID=A0ABR2FAN7_9ROSI
MATSSSSEGMPRQLANVEIQARYTKRAAKNIWEEQGFFFDDGLENYGLEPTIHRRLCELSWFRFARQPARANLNWVLEFYTNNAEGEDNVTQRVEHNREKPSLSQPPSLRPKPKLWNTFVKRNLMPTSHNQTIDRTRLVLINVIMTDYRFNVGEVIAQEISAACQNDKGILAFPCIISALCRRATVPTHPRDKYTVEKPGWSRKEYMQKMDVTDAAPIRVAMPTPPTSPTHYPLAAPEEVGPSAPAEARQTTLDSPLDSTPSTPSSSPPAQSEEAAPLHILQLRSQQQRIEARQLHFQEET